MLLKNMVEISQFEAKVSRNRPVLYKCWSSRPKVSMAWAVLDSFPGGKVTLCKTYLWFLKEHLFEDQLYCELKLERSNMAAAVLWKQCRQIQC